MDVLVSLGTNASYVYSMISIVEGRMARARYGVAGADGYTPTVRGWDGWVRGCCVKRKYFLLRGSFADAQKPACVLSTPTPQHPNK